MKLMIILSCILASLSAFGEELTPAQQLMKTISSMAGTYGAPSTLINGEDAGPMPRGKEMKIVAFGETLVVIDSPQAKVTFTPIGEDQILLTQIYSQYEKSNSMVGTVRENSLFFDAESMQDLDGIEEEEPENSPGKERLKAFVKEKTGVELLDSDNLENLAYTFDAENGVYSASTVFTRPSEDNRELFSMGVQFKKQ